MDDPVTTINEPVVVESHEDLAHGAGELGAQRVGRTLPVAARPDGPQLLEDLAAGGIDELLHALDERCAPDVVARLALLGEQLLDDVLRGDAGVVGPGHPKRFVASHSPPAGEDVLHRVVESVPHMQGRGDIRRRHQQHERRVLATVASGAGGVGMEHARCFPLAIQEAFGGARVVLGRDLREWFWRRHASGKLARGLAARLRLKGPPLIYKVRARPVAFGPTGELS